MTARWAFWKAFESALLPRGGGNAARVLLRAGPQTLDGMETGQLGRVVSVSCPDSLPDWGRWLAEIGFLPGEHVTVTARSALGGDPLVVRIGQSTFALRRAEAACVQVQPLAP